MKGYKANKLIAIQLSLINDIKCATKKKHILKQTVFISEKCVFLKRILKYLKDSHHVHILDSVNDISSEISLSNIPLPSHGGQGDIGGEEEEQTDQGDDGNDDDLKIKSRGGRSIRWGSIRGSGGSIGVSRGVIGFSRGGVAR